MIRIIDSTLRDGEQTPGLVFDAGDKKSIALALDRLGVEQIEAGVPAMGKCEQEAMAAILELGLKTRVSSWNRCVVDDIKASLDCGIQDVHISCPASDIQLRYKLRRSRQGAVYQLQMAADYALSQGCRVTIGAEDASRADPYFLMEMGLLAEKVGVERFRYCDTVGVLHPIAVYQRLFWMQSRISIPLEFHGHNDFGMATANSLAAVMAGVGYVNTTISGIGERAGNTSLQELHAALRHTCLIQANIREEALDYAAAVVAWTAGKHPGDLYPGKEFRHQDPRLHIGASSIIRKRFWEADSTQEWRKGSEMG